MWIVVGKALTSTIFPFSTGQQTSLLALSAHVIGYTTELAAAFCRAPGDVDRLADNACIADVVGEEQHEARVERSAVGLAQSPMRLDDGIVDGIGIGEIWIALQRHEESQAARARALAVATSAG